MQRCLSKVQQSLVPVCSSLPSMGHQFDTAPTVVGANTPTTDSHSYNCHFPRATKLCIYRHARTCWFFHVCPDTYNIGSLWYFAPIETWNSQTSHSQNRKIMWVFHNVFGNTKNLGAIAARICGILKLWTTYVYCSNQLPVITVRVSVLNYKTWIDFLTCMSG